MLCASGFPTIHLVRFATTPEPLPSRPGHLENVARTRGGAFPVAKPSRRGLFSPTRKQPRHTPPAKLLRILAAIARGPNAGGWRGAVAPEPGSVEPPAPAAASGVDRQHLKAGTSAKSRKDPRIDRRRKCPKSGRAGRASLAGPMVANTRAASVFLKGETIDRSGRPLRGAAALWSQSRSSRSGLDDLGSPLNAGEAMLDGREAASVRVRRQGPRHGAGRVQHP